MEQYLVHRTSHRTTIQRALCYFKPSHIYIRSCGSEGGDEEINEKLDKKELAIEYRNGGFAILIDKKEQFFFKYEPGVYNDWSIAYERFKPGNLVPIISGSGYPNPQEPYTGPDDPRLPHPRNTILRLNNDQYLLEITFPEKIPIRKGRLLNKKIGWWYWIVDL
ncbi:MAG: hypothetical protein AAB432_02510 [Patescibacteria group bacterium]